MPRRIQRKRGKGFNLQAASTNPNGYRYVGRGSRWGNPFTVGEKIEDDAVPNGYFIVDEATCLELFENHCGHQLMDDPAWLEPLRGKDLACWCPEGSPCHADILLRLANK